MKNLAYKERDGIIYINLGDNVSTLSVPKYPLKELGDLKIAAKESIHEMRLEALETAQRLVDRKIKRRQQF